MLRWTLGYTCLFPFWFPQCVCPAVGLLEFFICDFWQFLYNVSWRRSFLEWSLNFMNLDVQFSPRFRKFSQLLFLLNSLCPLCPLFFWTLVILFVLFWNPIEHIFLTLFCYFLFVLFWVISNSLFYNSFITSSFALLDCRCCLLYFISFTEFLSSRISV